MSITPVGAVDRANLFDISSLTETEKGDSSFKDFLRNAVEAANETDMQAKADELAVATGQSDDIHTLMIDVAKANLSLQTLVQLRNKALDAYNEIMKTTL
jgi:flagellar hook-basal body complex protein FliE